MHNARCYRPRSTGHRASGLPRLGHRRLIWAWVSYANARRKRLHMGTLSKPLRTLSIFHSRFRRTRRMFSPVRIRVCLR
jgi:hypothetical protein